MVLLVISWFLNFILISKTTLECHFERRTQSEVGKSVFEVCQISPLRSIGPPVEMTRCGCFCCERCQFPVCKVCQNGSDARR